MLQRNLYLAFDTKATRHNSGLQKQKLTRSDNMKSLRHVEDKWSADWLHPIARLGQSIAELFTITGSGMNHNMCKNYGHVLDKLKYSSRPKCADCGRIITNTAQIRASTLMETRVGQGLELA